jgi:hypothetical protein
VRRLQIYIEEEADERLGAEAARRGVSKAAIVREALGSYLSDGRDREPDPLDDLVGRYEGEPGDVDDVIYDT